MFSRSSLMIYFAEKFGVEKGRLVLKELELDSCLWDS